MDVIQGLINLACHARSMPLKGKEQNFTYSISVLLQEILRHWAIKPGTLLLYKGRLLRLRKYQYKKTLCTDSRLFFQLRSK